MSDFLIFKAAFNNSATPAIGTYTAEGATASFTQDASLSPDYYLYNPNASITAIQWFVPAKETTDFEFVADILTDDQSLGGDRYFSIADSAGATGLCMLSSSSITEWRFMNGDSTATSDPEYVGAIDPATSGGFGVFHQFRVRVRKLTASSSSVEVYVDGTLKLTATAGAALVTCAKIGFLGGITGSPSTSAGIKNAYVYDLSGGDVITRGVLSEAFNRFINWGKSAFVPLAGSNQIGGDLIPSTDGTVNLGSSSKKFASLNGIAPDELGLPTSTYTDISSYITHFDGTVNTFTAPVSGLFYLGGNSSNARDCAIINGTKGYAINLPYAYYHIRGLLPVEKGDTIEVYINSQLNSFVTQIFHLKGKV